MSNNKSNKLARKAGGHTVFQLGAGNGVSFNLDLLSHYKFMLSVTIGGSQGEVIKEFYKILQTYKDNPLVVVEVIRKTRLERQEVMRLLNFLNRVYKSESEIMKLFMFHKIQNTSF